MIIHNDCVYFKGYAPCDIHKVNNDIKCENCNYFEKINTKILIIKLEAIGDIIRTTPILHRLNFLYPNSKIYWLTNYPEVLPEEVDYKLKYNFNNIEVVRNIEFDLVINLDKDFPACALTTELKSKVKKGFCLINGLLSPIDKFAEHKYLTGISDSISKENKKHYIQEIFEISNIGEFNNEEYILNNIYNSVWNVDKTKKVIGLNTGCGDRWKSREWTITNWINLSKNLLKKGYEVVLLGGEKEDKLNKYISYNSNAKYFYPVPIDTFIDLINQCDLIVTQVTLALHIAIGLKKRIVLMNNIFNPNEFYLYGLGEIIEPKEKCECYYLQECKKEESCMNSITPDMIIESIERQLK